MATQPATKMSCFFKK